MPDAKRPLYTSGGFLHVAATRSVDIRDQKESQKPDQKAKISSQESTDKAIKRRRMSAVNITDQSKLKQDSLCIFISVTERQQFIMTEADLSMQNVPL